MFLDSWKKLTIYHQTAEWVLFSGQTWLATETISDQILKNYKSLKAT